LFLGDLVLGGLGLVLFAALRGIVCLCRFAGLTGAGGAVLALVSRGFVHESAGEAPCLWKVEESYMLEFLQYIVQSP
jgi:hypothetical protein